MNTPVTCKQRLEQYLREQGIACALQHHPLAYTSRGVAASEHLPAKLVAKTVMVIADGHLGMVVLPASRDLQISELGRELGANEVRLAAELEFGSAFPDCEVGAMPPFGNLYGLPVYVDASLAEDESIFFQAGTHTDTMRVSYTDFVRLVKPTVVNVAVARRIPTVLT